MTRLVSLAVVGALLLAAAPPTVVNRTGKPSLPVAAQYSSGGPFEFKWQAMPTTTTVITTRDAHLVKIKIFNTTAGAITVTFLTGDGVALPLSQSIPANTSVSDVDTIGTLCGGGFTIAAGAVGLNYSIVWTN